MGALPGSSLSAGHRRQSERATVGKGLEYTPRSSESGRPHRRI